MANDNKKSQVITFRINSTERRKLLEEAETADVSISEYIRSKVFKEEKEGKNE